MSAKKSSADITNIRHSLAHLLAAAILEKYPQTKLGVGPAVENGFYYDFLFPQPIAEKDLQGLEEQMRVLIGQKIDFKKEKVSLAEIKKVFKDQPFKLELAEEYRRAGQKLTIYRSGEFIDLCEGPHIKNTSEINPDAFKLTKIAGAYWKGDNQNKQLTRIYGVAFETPKELTNYLKMLEEAEKRDHRKLGRELDLFTFSELVGSGLPLYTPKGALIRRKLNGYVEELQSRAGYTQVWTPQISKADLFKTSGHYDKYRGDMFRVVSNYSEEEFFLKPMNCPQHTQIYSSRPRSYRDLPLRYTDFAMLYRDEKPGELNGLARVRSFSQDDCHVFCREDQVDKEIDLALAMTKEIMATFGFTYRYRLSTRDPEHPEKYLGDKTTWDKVEKWAEKIMTRNKIEYFDGPGEATFYAPKMDLMATDALGRNWQISTVQIDFFMPRQFGLKYIDADGQEKTPIMLHRAIIGSPERFIMILLEHFAGALPLWLSPIQAAVLPISDKFNGYAQKIAEELKSAGVRTELHDRGDTIGKKIREAEMQKIPYLVIVGEKEEKNKTVALRKRKEGDLGEIKLTDLIKRLQKEILEKTIS